MEKIEIERMDSELREDVLRIYELGIKTKNATFETNIPAWDSWDNSHRQDCRIVARIRDKIIGWAALSNVSTRRVYSGVAEVSIYIDPQYQGKGVGDKMIQALITESEKSNIWTLQAGIFPENKASVKLHLKHGFRIIGTRERIGKMDNQWRDVILLERRSKKVGID